MKNLKQKTTSSLAWSFIDNLATLGIQFIVGIIIARILSPHEFGLMGMTTVFIAFANAFIDGGFGNAIIRKQDCTQADYSTVFFFNLFIGFILFIILFFTAPFIGKFYDQPEVTPMIQALSLILIISSLTLVQQYVLVKNMKFKTQARISVISSILSGAVSIYMAYNGFGVWSLVIQVIIKQTLTSILLWFWNKWKPSLVFSKSSFKEMFTFGNNLLIGKIITIIYRNIYYLIIGKFFSVHELGLYTRAEQFKNLPSQNLDKIISSVTYPVLASMQHDLVKLKYLYKKLIRATMFITFTLMLGMTAVADNLILALIGPKWSEAIIFLQLLSFAGMLFPLQSLNINMLKVQGRSDLVLSLNFTKKLVVIPIIAIGVYLGMKYLLYGMVINSLIAYYQNSYWSGKFIGYDMKEQIKDIFPSFVLALVMAIIVYTVGLILPFSYLINLCIQLLLGATVMFVMSEIVKFSDYLYLKNIVLDKLKSFKKNTNEHK